MKNIALTLAAFNLLDGRADAAMCNTTTAMDATITASLETGGKPKVTVKRSFGF